MNKEKVVAIIFGTLVNFIALFLILTEAENKVLWAFLIPFMSWPFIAIKSEKLAIGFAAISAIGSSILFATGSFVKTTTLQSTLRFVFAFPVPTLLISALLFSTLSNKSETNQKKWAEIKSNVPKKEVNSQFDENGLPKL